MSPNIAAPNAGTHVHGADVWSTGAIKALGEVYVRIFSEVDEMAVNRHLMSGEEFAELGRDPLMRKFVALDSAGQPVGLSCITRDVASWGLVSPRALRRRYPEAYAAGKLFYVGFVGVLPGNPGVFPQLLEAMSDWGGRGNGEVYVMDFCGYNVDLLKIPTLGVRALRSFDDRAQAEMIDRQEFWAVDFQSR